MNTPKISVIVPIYRIENYLPQCVDSLLGQSFKDFELILVNDGSPDSCPQICDSYAKQDSRVKAVHKANGGLLSARKAGLEAASGEYIAWVDGDDWVDPHFLSILYKLAKENDADLTVTGHFREFDGKIETIKPNNPGVYNEEEIKSSIITKAIFNGEFCEHGMSTYVWNKLYKKDLLEKVLFNVHNDIVMGEDAAITYSYLALSKSLVISKIPLYYYRQRHDSIVKSIENPAMEYYRLGLLMNHLYRHLEVAIDKVALKKQIDFYLYSQLLVRSGGLINLDNGSKVFNPFKNIKKGSKIAVYSSGSFGQHVVSTNLKTNYFNIMNWVDIDYHDLKIGNTMVEPISAINNDDIDNLIIATINPSTHRMIEKELELFGISKDKIEKIEINDSKINQLFKDLGFDENFLFQADIAVKK
ncbi:MAG: glycosyltransferase family 2 protein [Winogradskyella sp.]|uniref:glycosyltransferase family 2 protein n=1 Tax=Winogradskyella sp. TaxID=1883156 RepID=UPI0025FF02DF|nr:glycosyltransferase family 2 protein [Winogradskyella sp.]NRB59200.1 glycosyltransferase family 2 protein [Winogradskyella sp.]